MYELAGKKICTPKEQVGRWKIYSITMEFTKRLGIFPAVTCLVPALFKVRYSA